VYAALDGWRRQMVESGEQLLGAALALAERLRADLGSLPGLNVVGEDELTHHAAAHELDRLQVLIDISGLEISGYQAADWLREHERLDMGLSDHRRILATVSMSDDEETIGRLRAALERLVDEAPTLPAPHPVQLPEPTELELETVELPREAFFGPVEDVPARQAIGRVAAEQITPYPPGIPVIVPGERINRAVVDYLLSGLKAGMVLPDPADQSLGTIRVAADSDR
jgi:arginine/lysine/ornithine decarboxylase